MKRCQCAMLMACSALAMLLVAACTFASPFRTSEVDELKVKILAPADQSTALQGGTIAVRAFIDDDQGIAWVQLWVDGRPAGDIVIPKVTVTQFSQDLHWTPGDVGPHTVKVVFENGAGDQTESEPITLYVSADPSLRATAIAAQLATATPDPLAVTTPIPASPSTPPPPFTPTPTPCHDDAAYVAEPTLPPGGPLEAGTAFDMTWRLLNSGTCIWDTRYTFVFVDGSQLEGPSPTALPHEVSPGEIVEITVPMIAPDAAGTYTSQWQMRAPAESNFGAIVRALVEVGPGAVGSLPRINRLEVSPGVIRQGQAATLYWEYVNGTSGRLTPGGERGVAPAGQLLVSPNATTGYRLVVGNAAGTVERAITLVVQSGPISPLPPASPANLTITATRPDGFDLTWVDTSTNEQGFRLYNAGTTQVVATFPLNGVDGAFGGLACGTSYRFYLVAFNQRGESWPSNTVQATTSACGG